jgi:hypothetical protein
MTHDDLPEYGTPPEPKYGRRADPPVEPAAGDWDHVPPTPEQIRRLRKAVRETEPSPEPRRDPFGITLAIVLLIFGGVLSALASQGGWWSLMWVLAAPFLFFGVAGFAIDVRKVPRDEKGRPLP